MEIISVSIVALLLPALGVILNSGLSRFMRGKKKDIVMQKNLWAQGSAECQRLGK